MIPGTTSKLSESLIASTTTITVKTDLVRLSGSTAIATINDQFGGGFGGILFIMPTASTIATTTAGNIAKVVSMPSLQVTVFVYSKATGLWYPGAIS
jgi:hypothetical protein